jgi:hypothetical protein
MHLKRTMIIQKAFPIPKARLLRFFLIGVLATGIVSVEPARAQTSAQTAQAQSLASQAAGLRSYAHKRQEQAEQWRERAEKARERAERSASPEDRESWLRDAEEYEERAATAAADAEEAETRAAAAEKEAAALGMETGAPASTAPPRSPAPAESTAEEEDSEEKLEISLRDVFGYWRQGETDTPFVIVPEDADFEAYQNRLEAHTGDRIWKGEYEPFDKGDIRRFWDARLTFTYKPGAREMNPEVPLWARQKVEGKLEWRIELNEAGTHGTPKLEGLWWPGEIAWREKGDKGGRKAWVSGRGDPVRMGLSPANDLLVVPNPSPIIVIGLPRGPNPILEPVKAVLKGQLFLPAVRIPPSLAEKTGGSVTVTLSGQTGGDSTDLRLPRTQVWGPWP